MEKEKTMPKKAPTTIEEVPEPYLPFAKGPDEPRMLYEDVRVADDSPPVEEEELPAEAEPGSETPIEDEMEFDETQVDQLPPELQPLAKALLSSHTKKMQALKVDEASKQDADTFRKLKETPGFQDFLKKHTAEMVGISPDVTPPLAPEVELGPAPYQSLEEDFDVTDPKHLTYLIKSTALNAREEILKGAYQKYDPIVKYMLAREVRASLAQIASNYPTTKGYPAMDTVNAKKIDEYIQKNDPLMDIGVAYEKVFDRDIKLVKAGKIPPVVERKQVTTGDVVSLLRKKSISSPSDDSPSSTSLRRGRVGMTIAEAAEQAEQQTGFRLRG